MPEGYDDQFRHLQRDGEKNLELRGLQSEVPPIESLTPFHNDLRKL